eukprot:NODE_4137_length_706_cov_271.711214.p2 GENE.NODE_4137_length_706_cov_271.711214~~NODE_4137_length_706_cov_271.711214.p2  ORF type:complete len:177 (-),score=61.13 NODE_4137_length_706_cov_271.711214:158-688(-)
MGWPVAALVLAAWGKVMAMEEAPCYQQHTIYQPTMNGGFITEEETAEECQGRCHSTDGGIYFSFFKYGGCQLADGDALKAYQEDVESGSHEGCSVEVEAQRPPRNKTGKADNDTANVNHTDGAKPKEEKRVEPKEEKRVAEDAGKHNLKKAVDEFNKELEALRDAVADKVGFRLWM